MDIQTDQYEALTKASAISRTPRFFPALRKLKLGLRLALLLLVGPSTLKASTLTWDLGAAMGSYGGSSYTEVNLGVNWHLTDYLIWRNAGFGRFSELENITGLDTSARFHTFLGSEDASLGVGLFGGPGYRFSQTHYSAAFAEAGLILKLVAFQIGGGVKQFYYPHPGTDAQGKRLANSDTVIFLILSGGGAF